MPLNKYYIYPYNPNSESARLLSQALEAKRIKLQGSKYKQRNHKKIINWGSSSCPYECLNPSNLVGVFCNKLTSFWTLCAHKEEDITRLPRFTEDREEAISWLDNSTEFQCKKVVARKILTSHSGNGIVIVGRDNPEELPDAPLYVEYVPKDKEYRVHVFNGEVIDVQRKIRDPSREPNNWQVRSHNNGFIYQRHNISPEADVIEQAVRAVRVSGLLFAAVDVVWNENREKAYVLELNTAPGLQGETVEIYAEAFKGYLDNVL